MNFGNVARVLTITAACFAAVGSATSNTNNGPATQTPEQQAQNSPPPAQQMEANRALGLWRSTFGAVKIGPDDSHGGLQTGAVQGIWTYQRQGQDVIGYFFGTLDGNVLKFRWNEPGNPPLTGEGYIVFEQSGRQYSGRWWSDKHDRVGDWNGWRQGNDTGSQPAYNNAQYGGSQYGGQQAQPYPPQGPYPQQPTYPQGQYPQQQPYPPQGQYPQQPQQQPYPPQGQYPQQQYPQQQYPQQPQQQPYPPQGQYPQQQYPQQPQQPQQQPYPPQRT